MLKADLKNRDSIYSRPFILISVVVATIIVFCTPSKAIGVFTVLPLTALLYIVAPRFAKIVFPIIMITFPITLQIWGKDAFSTGTLIIFLTLAWALMKYRIEATIASDIFLFTILFLLICIAFTGMVTKTSGEYWGTAIRYYMNFISSIAVFILIIHSQHIHGTANNKRDYIEKIISVLLLITVVHIFLSLLMLGFPWVEKYFVIFLKRTQEHFSGYIVDGVYTRATTVFTGGEEFGELLILLFPFSLYKVFVSKNKLYFLVAASLFLGTIGSGTRSAFLIIVFQIVFFIYVLVPRRYNNRKFIFTAAFIFISVLMLPVFLKYASVLIDRVLITLDKIGKQEGLVSILNRDMVWPMAYDVTSKTISFFGHGPIQAHALGFPARNFHSLYLSMLFQFGIIGTAVFFAFFFKIGGSLLKVLKKNKNKGQDYLLSATCLLSLACFLINEIKFEFNRSDSYQQTVWIIFAVFYLTGQLWRNPRHEKTRQH